jgi:outer membrane protein assembly factor BamB
VNPATGEPEWTGELNSRTKIESSPTAADDRIYFMDHRGEVFVIAAGPEFKILHQTNMADADDSDLRSCIAISQGNLFIRTGSKLYCIGE